MQYRWAEGSNVPVDPQIAGEFVRKTMDANGGVLTPAMLSESNRDDSSPLHGLFTWNDTEAEQKWREVIRSLEVVLDPDAEES